ncbi:phytanoyl-CoA dioxygenase family protein [Lentzea tibetensis]|uniref:Phytanoyl-CoA dioxygenase family protein n=1 Tax=Lentzea tibetensis TaxID=2591470 RepID=A0A563EMS2_9PSEU|nr:phytanoyl-CoA dioxygenase family protein [Lentzea tibetensis]TWP48486.1 phytanoyl-CoA dioxygenase family protein [Lentzea tibetensis]
MTFTVAAEQADVLAAVVEHGIARVPGYLSPAENARLVADVERFLEAPPERAKRLDYSGGAGVRAEREFVRAGFPVLDEVFDRPWMREVAAAFFGDEPHLFNHDVIAVLDLPGTVHAAHHPHYDRMPNLKFFLYLTDVDESTGAFRCVPGSHGYAKAAQRENRLAGVLPGQDETRVLPDSVPQDTRPVDGPAGTLLVIDSDLVHEGGKVAHGRRLAVRGRSFHPAYADGWSVKS